MDYPKRNGLKQTPLKRNVGLKTRTKLKPMSTKAKTELKVWTKVKADRIAALISRYGFLPCEYCLTSIAIVNTADAHHNNHNRRDCSFENCRITHSYCNRISIEDNNIKDVPSLL